MRPKSELLRALAALLVLADDRASEWRISFGVVRCGLLQSRGLVEHLEAGPVAFAYRVFACKRLPAPDCNVDKQRGDFESQTNTIA